MWKEKRTELKKYLVNNGFTLPKLGKRHKSTGSENWVKIRETQRNVFHCTSQFNFWIQKQRKSPSTAREKWCVERGIRSQVTPVSVLFPVSLSKHSTKITYKTAVLIWAHHSQILHHSREVLVAGACSSWSWCICYPEAESKPCLSLAGCPFFIQSRMGGMVLPIFSMRLPSQLA